MHDIVLRTVGLGKARGSFTALAPASAVNWKINSVLAAFGLALAIIGALRFRVRDLQVE